MGYDSIKRFQSAVPAVTNENTAGKLIKSFFEKELLDHPEALQAFVEYVACFMNIPEEHDSYDSLGEKLDTEKGIDFQTLKSKCEPEPLNKVTKASLDTMQGEKVRSVEELTIANFLYLNGIEYDYEKRYPYGDVVYQPDFYLKDYDIYLEHFGVNEDNTAKWLTPYNEQKYIAEMELKRETHKTYHTKLIETYSYYNRDKVLLDKLKELLEKEQVIFKPRDVKSIYTKVTENEKNFGQEITKLVETFINLSKSRQLDYASITQLFLDKNKTKNDYMLQRQQLFYSLPFPF
ncbi:hypothetical protein H9X57_07630 [Flavobacterium piscinae]|uniref:hypothetical protein n=1 Tax=Flavobacterium piscinae TaxID=2506424 RepID=UPI0019B18DCE|nr:hypothetical protein [Flavobacterium piscinae]MBC8883349.1 hypothetical protein [Flavobacterium piscinae]